MRPCSSQSLPLLSAAFILASETSTFMADGTRSIRYPFETAPEPGQAIEVLRPLLAVGARIDGSPAIYCSNGPGPRFDRYLPMSFALL